MICSHCLFLRFFIIHEDGSGTELLRFKDLYSYLRTMDLDPSTAVVREPLLSNPKVTGATVMKPFQGKSFSLLLSLNTLDACFQTKFIAVGWLHSRMIPWFLPVFAITHRPQRWHVVILPSQRVTTPRRTIWMLMNKRSSDRVSRTTNSSHTFNQIRWHQVSPVNNRCLKCRKHSITETSWNSLDYKMMSGWNSSQPWSMSSLSWHRSTISFSM